jgi:hypothetical protein
MPVLQNDPDIREAPLSFEEKLFIHSKCWADCGVRIGGPTVLQLITTGLGNAAARRLRG